MNDCDIYTKDIKYNSAVLYKIHELENDFNVIKTHITEFENQVNDKLDGFENNIDSLKDKINDFRDNLLSLAQRILTIESTIDSHNTAITNLQNDINSIEDKLDIKHINSTYGDPVVNYDTEDGISLNTDAQITYGEDNDTLTVEHEMNIPLLSGKNISIDADELNEHVLINLDYPSESHTITSFQELDNDPFDHYVDITLTHTLSEKSVVELINDDGINFAKYCFTIISLTNQVVRVACIGEPSSITLKFKFLEE